MKLQHTSLPCVVELTSLLTSKDKRTRLTNHQVTVSGGTAQVRQQALATQRTTHY